MNYINLSQNYITLGSNSAFIFVMSKDSDIENYLVLLNLTDNMIT
jgi:hypothetical protein